MDTLEITRRIRALRQMTVNELRCEYINTFGEENRSRNKDYLVKRIAWRIQANTFGGMTERAKLRAKELANEADLRIRQNPTPPAQTQASDALVKPLSPGRDSRLPPPGTFIERAFRGKVIRVQVEEEAFVWEEREYKSLSAIAREVTGKAWNGFVFFKLDGTGGDA